MSSEILAGKVIMVTGGGRGIGRAACSVMAREGAALIVVDRHLGPASETVSLVESLGGTAHALEGDVTSEADMGLAVESALSRYGKLDCAFNNAGIGPREVGAKGALLTEIDRAQWSSILDVNLTGVWQCMKVQIPAMKAGASIVNNASVAGLTGMAGSAAYVASKHGVVGLSKSAALEWAQQKIRINAICPGYVHTQMTPQSDALAARIPAGRLGVPNDIAELVAWLCSDMASYVTGTAINVDGGFLSGTHA